MTLDLVNTMIDGGCLAVLVMVLSEIRALRYEAKWRSGEK